MPYEVVVPAAPIYVRVIRIVRIILYLRINIYLLPVRCIDVIYRIFEDKI